MEAGGSRLLQQLLGGLRAEGSGVVYAVVRTGLKTNGIEQEVIEEKPQLVNAVSGLSSALSMVEGEDEERNMGKERKSNCNTLKHCGAPYQQTRREVVQQATEDKPRSLNPFIKLYNIMYKRETKGEGASKIPGETLKRMLTEEKECESCIVKYKKGFDCVKDQEKRTPKKSESEETSKN
ncbi:uncharacterized protein RHO17_003788 [Thomomys bottae]